MSFDHRLDLKDGVQWREVTRDSASPWMDDDTGRHGTEVETHSWSNPEESIKQLLLDSSNTFLHAFAPLASPREINGRLRS